MDPRKINYFIGLIFWLFVFLAVAMGGAFMAPAFEGIAIDFKTYVVIALGLLFFPLAASLAAYFEFLGVPEAKKTLTPMRSGAMTFILLFALGLLSHLLISDRVLSAMISSTLKAEASLGEERIRAYQDLGNLWERFEKGGLEEKRKVIRRLEALKTEAPYDLELHAMANTLKRKVFSQGKTAETLNRKKSLLERRAIELRNQKDFQGALQCYNTLLEIYPAKAEYAFFREHYAQMAYFMRALDKDPEIQLDEQEIERLFLNRKLNEVEKLIEGEHYFKAYEKIRNIYLDRKNHLAVKSLFEIAQTKLLTEEFLLTDYLLKLKHLPQKRSFGPISILLDEKTLRSEKSYYFEGALFLENVKVVDTDKRLEYPYALLAGNRLFLKNKPLEKSYIIEDESIGDLIKEWLLLIQANPLAWQLASLPRMLSFKKTSQRLLGSSPSPRWFNLKLIYFCLLPGLYLFFLRLSWNLKPHILFPFRLTFMLLCLVGLFLVFFIFGGMLGEIFDVQAPFSYLLIATSTAIFFILNLWYLSRERDLNENHS